ncbi:MAG: GntG family PLP-dependent aldolase [Bdellovibrionota bacterium]
MFQGVDLYSDTMTRPTRAMREAMAAAEVGDEQKGEDPTTLALEAGRLRCLAESALFFPSATMANEVAIMLHCSHGDELVAAENCHLFFAETGGPAKHAGVQTRMVPTANGIFDAEAVERHFNAISGPHFMVSRLLSIENTTNLGGGVAWPRTTLAEVVERAKSLGLKLHLDGSRLFNAAVASECEVKTLAAGFDTVTICFSKGLGCPTGAVLAFEKSKWDRVRRLKQLMGGAMRQSGMLAAAALYALEHHAGRLHEDHENARLLAEGLANLPFVRVENEAPSTNMVFFENRHPKLDDSAFSQACEKVGVRFSQVGRARFRAVTHLDVSRADIERTLELLAKIGTQA